MRKILLSLILASLSICSYGQALNATVTVNSDRIQGTDKDIFTTLERAVSDAINGNDWTTASFATNERIECTFSFTISEQEEATNNFKAELYVMARRPVYNSSYYTTILNWRDTKIEFTYSEGTPIQIQEGYVSNNLEATICFYCYLILGLDFDSFSPLGGSTFYRSAQSLATSAQSSNWAGWSAFDDNRSKTSIINALSEERMKAYREYWYTYHRRALDEMASNPDRARTTILNGLSVLKEVRNVRGSEIVLQMFADCKLDEIAQIGTKANQEEKKATYDILNSLFPTQSDQFESLKK